MTMQPRFADRLDALLDTVIALKRELADHGHLISAMSPDFASAIYGAAGGVGTTVAEPYAEIAPGARFGFRRGAKPELRLRSVAASGRGGVAPGTALAVTLDRPTDSTWLTLELDWPTAAFREKGGARLLVRGTAAGPLSLDTRLRAEAEGAAPRDIPGTAVTLGAAEATSVIEFPASPTPLPDVPILRILIFFPVTPFDLRLTSLRIL